MDIVQEKSNVSVHYTGTLETGEVFDSSRERDPLSFTVGEGQMIPGFEKAVKGMKLNESKKITIAPEEAYGAVRPDMVQTITKEQLPPELVVSVGQQLASEMPDGQQIIVTVTDVTENEITIDANHPLAGKTLNFDIEVVKIEG